MRVAIYTIALNEEQFVERWYESAKEADYLLIADTGSTDKTVELAKSLGINVVSVSISPWRFDDARNAAMAQLPLDIDYCISLDMDEIITPGWREPLEKALKSGITRPKYKHIWSWKEDGTPGLEFAYDHIHARKGYRWKHPVHETLFSYGITEITNFIDGLETHHHPDPTKSRSQYLPLLAMSVQEDPHSDRNIYYYARELFFYGKYQEAAVYFKRHLEMPTSTWAAERTSSYRYLAKCEPENAFDYLHKAIALSPGRREAIVEMAQMMYENKNWTDCYEFAIDALKIAEKPLDYLCEEFAWGSLPHDLASISAYNLGNVDDAILHIKNAIQIDPTNDRLIVNLAYYNQDKQSKNDIIT
jgi:glycosyltransferase involved in cell wall biosynthesis